MKLPLQLSLNCIETTFFPTFKLLLRRNIPKYGIVSIADIIYPTRSGVPSVVSTGGTSVCCDGQDVLKRTLIVQDSYMTICFVFSRGHDGEMAFTPLDRVG